MIFLVFFVLAAVIYLLSILPVYIGVPLLIIGLWNLYFRVWR
jgi:hypothetical protein